MDTGVKTSTSPPETGPAFWGPLMNLAPVVNSDQDDRCPAFSPDYSVFYFDSEREGGYGDKDLWRIAYALIEEIR